jgi:hypothetical protein
MLALLPRALVGLLGQLAALLATVLVPWLAPSWLVRAPGVLATLALLHSRQEALLRAPGVLATLALLHSRQEALLRAPGVLATLALLHGRQEALLRAPGVLATLALLRQGEPQEALLQATAQPVLQAMPAGLVRAATQWSSTTRPLVLVPSAPSTAATGRLSRVRLPWPPRSPCVTGPGW